MSTVRSLTSSEVTLDWDLPRNKRLYFTKSNTWEGHSYLLGQCILCFIQKFTNALL